MNEKNVQAILAKWLIENKVELFTTNITAVFAFECDILALSKAGISTEYEIKMSRSDFFADFKKGKSYSGIDKHFMLQTGERNSGFGWQRTPNRFYFVVPKGLVTDEEVPEYCGWIEILPHGEVMVRRKAKMLHNGKINKAQERILIRNAMIKYGNLLWKIYKPKK